MTRIRLSATVFFMLLISSALVHAIEAAPVDATAATQSDVDAGAAVAVSEEDQALLMAVRSAMNRYAFFDVFGWITVSADNGVVTLDGVVREPFQSRGYETRVGRVDGVTSVVNNLEALPLSAYDDQIRRAAIRSLASQGTLSPLIRQPRPAIHVIVANGRVRLEGVVRTELDRMLAETGIRRATLAFGIVNNLQVEQS